MKIAIASEFTTYTTPPARCLRRSRSNQHTYHSISSIHLSHHTLLPTASLTNNPPPHYHHHKQSLTNDSIPPSNRSKVKSSVQRGLRQRFLDTYPGFEPYIEEVLPKKAQLDAVKLYAPYPIPLYPTYIPTILTHPSLTKQQAN